MAGWTGLEHVRAILKETKRDATLPVIVSESLPNSVPSRPSPFRRVPLRGAGLRHHGGTTDRGTASVATSIRLEDI